jgi:predicted amidohydrolase YtcJ
MEPWHKEMSIRAFGKEKAHDLTLRFKSLMQAGVHVFGGSDCHPCEERWLSPLGQIYLNHVEGPLNEAERLSREEAVAMFTTSPARASFEEDHKGRIAAGMLADMVVLSDNPMTVSGDDLLKIKVERTFVGGETVYERSPGE